MDIVRMHLEEAQAAKQDLMDLPAQCRHHVWVLSPFILQMTIYLPEADRNCT
jgi:hypothetical protein